jgi:hypothetical protein
MRLTIAEGEIFTLTARREIWLRRVYVSPPHEIRHSAWQGRGGLSPGTERIAHASVARVWRGWTRAR